MLNKIFLLGRLGKDPESKKIGDKQTHMITLPLAVQKTKKDADGNYETTWVTCKAFDKTADLIAKYCKKGSQVLVEGELNINKWKNQTGEFAYFTEVLIGKITFLSKSNTEEKKEEPIMTAQPNDLFDEDGYVRDDIPF
jgi:single-strand DNA-binding protein